VTTCVGVDVGGTFTDFVLVDGDGFAVLKRASTPTDPAQAVVEGLGALDPGASAAVAHGTTVATNALLERHGARTAFITTRGFGDMLALGRGERSALYSLEPPPRVSLVPPELCFEVDERIGADGAVVRALGPAEARRAAARVGASGADAVAVCLLFSYLQPDHERRLGAALAAALGSRAHVSLSVDVLAEFREYERASTTVVNAYVAPLVARYLARLEGAVAPRALSVMGSHAGTLTPRAAGRLPVTTVLSGPAAGVQGALAVAQRAGQPRIISFDMGGTSTDVALCDGAVPFAQTTHVGGVPVHRPSVDVHTVGAGGGSIVRADAGGAVRVGPQSAGADPGPAAYGRGGRLPTVTDAHVILGRLPAEVPLAGGLRLDVGAARGALAPVAAALGMSVEEAALGALAVANATMERALRRVSVERGHAPSDFSLVAFGGAGPLHACALAEAIGARDVLVPRLPGALSALGLAIALPVATASRSVVRPPGADAPDFSAVYADLEREARELLGGVPAVTIGRSADIRYVGQSWELTVAWSGDTDPVPSFEAAHARVYGYARPGAPVEVVNLRVRAEGARRVGIPPAPPPSRARPSACTTVLDDRTAIRVPLYRRDALFPGETIAGPAVISQVDATTFVAPGWSGRVGAWGDLWLERVQGRAGRSGTGL
jgi:N-methylhydantoinase A